MKNRDGLENSDHWATPKALYNELNAEFNFDFDPCPLYATFNGLEIEWGRSNFINPPYNREDKPKFIEKTVQEWKKGKACVLLIPSATGTKQFHKYFWDKDHHCPRPGVQIRFLEGRIAFEGINTKGEFTSTKKGKHDSMIVILDGEYWR